MSVLLIISIVCFILWAYFIWSRRRFYYFASKFSGPRGWPLIGIALRIRSLENLLLELTKIAEEYKHDTGFSWVGPLPFLATKEPAIIEKILNSPDCLDKPHIYDPFIEALGGGLLTLGSPKCTTHRKMLNPAFSHNILLSFFSIFNEGTNTLIQDFSKFVGKGESDLSTTIYGCTLRISIETTMGMNGNEYREKSVKLVPHTKTVLRTTMNRLVQPWLRIDAIFRQTKMYKPYKEAKAAVDNFVKEVIDQKMKSKQIAQNQILDQEDSTDNFNIRKSKNNFIDQALEMYFTNQFDWDDLFGESSSILYAAFETTASTFHSALIFLAMHPQYQERLFEEIVSAFPEKDFIVNYDDFPKLIYMDMVINETLRIAATVPIISRYAGADVYISENITIPKGTQLVIDIFNMHRNPSIWGPNATSFNPDNFLPGNLSNKHPFAFIPFSKGPRNCIGWHYAKMLLKVVLAKVIRNYRFTTSFPFEDLHFVGSLTLDFKVTPHLEIQMREE